MCHCARISIYVCGHVQCEGAQAGCGAGVHILRALQQSAMANTVPCDITIKRVVSVECPGQKTPWIIDTMEAIDGVEFVALKLRCSAFCRFIAGTFKDFKFKNQSFLQELISLRTQATIDAMEPKAHTG